MAKFTVELEVGRETRELIERLAAKTAVQVELGPMTLEVIRKVLAVERDAERAESPDAHPAQGL